MDEVGTRWRITHGGTKPQIEFWKHPARFRAFVGGVGSGKTRAGVVEIFRQPAGSRGTVVAPTYRMLMDATIHTFLEVTEECGILKDYKKSDQMAWLTNDTEILFRSSDDPDKLRGPNLGWFCLDEGAMMHQQVWDLMIGRLRLDPGRGWITTTPRGMNWLYKLFVTKKMEDYHLVQCSSKTNTFLPSYFIKSLEDKYSGYWLKQELDGGFVEFVEAAAYEDFKSSINVGKGLLEEYYDPRLPLRLGCDFNNRIMAWPVIQVINDQPVILCEISQLKKASVPDMVRKFRMKFPQHVGGLRIFPDASGKAGWSGIGMSILEIMEREFMGYPSEVEFYVPKSNPKVPDRIHTVNQLLRGANVWKPLLIDETCDYVIEDMQRVQWNHAGTGIDKCEDPSDDRSLLTHATDGLGYWGTMDMPSSFFKETAAEILARQGRENRERIDYHGGLAGI